MENNFDMNGFMAAFVKKYVWLYDMDKSPKNYYKMIEKALLYVNATEHDDFMKSFFRIREDYLSSDRELAAFGYTLQDYCLD